MTVTAATMAIALDLLIVFVGARFFVVPIAAAAAFGVPVRTDDGGACAYLTVKGLRDVVSGVVGLAILAFAGLHAEAWFMLAVALTPLGDTVIVLKHGGTKTVAFGIHFATAMIVLAGAALLFAS